MSEEEKQELETLRREKRRQTQETRARAALTAAALPEGFAALLVGEDDADTDRRAEIFREAYQAALTEDIRRRLPEKPPVTTPPKMPRPVRGVWVLG